MDGLRTAVIVAGNTAVCGVIAMRNEQNPTLGTGALEFTTDEKKNIIRGGDSKLVAVIRERSVIRKRAASVWL